MKLKKGTQVCWGKKFWAVIMDKGEITQDIFCIRKRPPWTDSFICLIERPPAKKVMALIYTTSQWVSFPWIPPFFESLNPYQSSWWVRWSSWRIKVARSWPWDLSCQQRSCSWFHTWNGWGDQRCRDHIGTFVWCACQCSFGPRVFEHRVLGCLTGRHWCMLWYGEDWQPAARGTMWGRIGNRQTL